MDEHESVNALRQTYTEENETSKKLVRLVTICLGIVVLIVALGIGIVTYNSVNNAPKVQCTYRVTQEIVHDLHVLAAHQGQHFNAKDFPEAVC